MTERVDDRWLTIRELADQLRLHERTIRRLKANGDIPFTKIGGAIRFKQSDVDAYLDSLTESE